MKSDYYTIYSQYENSKNRLHKNQLLKLIFACYRYKSADDRIHRYPQLLFPFCLGYPRIYSYLRHGKCFNGFVDNSLSSLSFRSSAFR